MITYLGHIVSPLYGCLPMSNIGDSKMRMAESLIKNSIPDSRIVNGLVFKTFESSRKRVFLGSIYEVIGKILRGELD